MDDVYKGSTDITTYVNLVDSAAGTPETGLTIANIDATYTRMRAAAVKNDLTALAAADTAHTDNKGIEVDATNAPGLYRVDWPDAAFATGADQVVLTVTCSGCAPAHRVVKLKNINDQDGVRAGLTALPNAAADAAGGLPISDAGGLDLDAKLANTNEVTAARMGALTDWINGGRLDLIIDDILQDTGTTLQGEVDGIQADTEDIQSKIGTPAGVSLSADIAAIEAQTDDIGAAGAGLTAVPWNAAWDAEVQSEVDDALVAQRLDELLNADSDIDGAAPPTVGSVFHEVLSKTAGSFTYDQTTDSLEAIRDKETDIETDTQDILAAVTSTGAVLTAAERNAIADAILKRDVDQVEASTAVHSLCSAVLKLVSRFKGSTGVTYRTDGTTVHMTQTPVTNENADPISELGVAS